MDYRDSGWYYRSPEDRAPAWTAVEFLYQYLVRQEQSPGPFARQVAAGGLELGDVIQLGDAGGQNWFCVLFPPLCVPAAADADDAPAYTDAQQAAVTSPYRVKFAAAEAVEWVKETLLGADGAQEASSEADAAPEESEPALEGEGAAAPVSQAAQDAGADAEEAAPRRAPKRARDEADDDWDAPA